MIRLIVPLLVLVLLAACSPQDQASTAPQTDTAATSAAVKTHQPREVPRHSAAAFFETTAYSGISFNRAGSHVVVNHDKTGVYNAYTMPITGGEPVALTESTDNAVFGLGYFADDKRLLYISDKGGNELFHVFVREADGSVKDLTPGDEVRASFMGFNRKRDAFYVQTNERDAKAMDLYRYDADSYERTMVFQNDNSLSIGDISGDGNTIALGKTINNTEGHLYLADLSAEKVEPKRISPEAPGVVFSGLTFDDKRGLFYFRTNGEGEFNQAWTHNLETGEQKAAIVADWDVLYVGFSESGRYRIHGINEDAVTKITIRDMEAGQDLVIPNLPDGDLRTVRFSDDEKTLAFYINADTSPSNLFVVNMADKSFRKLTEAMNPAINASDLVEGQVVRYKSFDDLEIPSILYRPWPASADNQVPALVFVHGGPGGQSRKGYRAMFQHLVNHGYAVLAVNNRGSNGYGKTFFHMDDRKHGDVDLKDVVAGRGYLESLDWVDKDKIGIIGGSYGGYMTVAALAFTPEVFDVGIDIFGVTNWERTLASIPPWWESFRKALYDEMGDPAVDKERHHAISPLFHAENITKPLLVVQGANDPRVLQVESDEMVEKVRANGVPVTYVLFPDEGHGFLKRENRIKASEAYLTFLNQYLKEKPAEQPKNKDS